jgi:hypothetical protein
LAGVVGVTVSVVVVEACGEYTSDQVPLLVLTEMSAES